MEKRILDLVNSIAPQLSNWRRHIHAHPELSFEEYETAAYVRSQLLSMGIDEVQSIGNTGLVALIQGTGQYNKCIALRADMDALPIQEANSHTYASKHDGVMHACGHDVHTACLLGAAYILKHTADTWSGSVKLIFQPGEEKSPGGASLLIAQGVLDNPKVDTIIGLHVSPEMTVNQVGFRPGPFMASADEIHITIHGKSGHAAMPQSAIDPITIAANVIVQLQQLFSRHNQPFNPTVLSFGKISGGNSTNVIPESAELKGTFRAFDESWRKQALQIIQDTTHAIAALYGGSATVHIPQGYPYLHNDPEITEMVISAASEIVGENNILHIPQRMTAEDFAYYAQTIPACFFRIGTNNAENQFSAPVHNDHFDIDESAISVGASIMANAAMHYLKG